MTSYLQYIYKHCVTVCIEKIKYNKNVQVEGLKKRHVNRHLKILRAGCYNRKIALKFTVVL